MKLFKFFIVTYNQPKQLKLTYESLIRTLGSFTDYEISIINNHSHFEFEGKAKVFHNELRPDDSIGYLSRNWNQAILHGFKSAREPDSKWIILVQSDVIFQAGWLEWFLSESEKNSFDLLQFGPGDQTVFLNLEAFMKVGWFDERFTTLALQEYDYFLRSYLHLGNRCQLQGHYGVRGIFNPPAFSVIQREEEYREGHSMEGHPWQHRWFEAKWGAEVHRILRYNQDPEKWTRNIDHYFENQMESGLTVPSCYPKEINWYPYFYFGLNDQSFSSLYY